MLIEKTVRRIRNEVLNKSWIRDPLQEILAELQKIHPDLAEKEMINMIAAVNDSEIYNNAVLASENNSNA